MQRNSPLEEATQSLARLLGLENGADVSNIKAIVSRALSRAKNTDEESLSSYMFGKVMPHSIALEEAVLGALLLEKNAIDRVSSVLTKSSFYVEAHQSIYEVLLEMRSKRQNIDLLTVTEALKERGLLSDVGGPYYLVELTNRVASTAHLESHADIIAAKAVRRDVINLAGSLMEDTYDDTKDVFETITSTHKSLNKSISSMGGGSFKQGMELAGLIADKVDQIAKAQEEGLVRVKGEVPTPIRALDSLAGYWQPSDLVIIPARPGMGKTALMLAQVKVCLELEIPVAIFSLEMSALALCQRLATVF